MKTTKRRNIMRDFIRSINGALFRRSPSLATAAAVLLTVPLLAHGAELMHVKWEGLSIMTGQTVRIALPGGAVITGKAASVESDALVIDVKKTSDRNAYPKGALRVPREKLHRLEMRTKGNVGRVVMTSLGAIAGVGGGAAAFVRIAGGNGMCWLGCSIHSNHGAAAAAFVGIASAGTAGGYFAGNALDKRWTVVEILP
jgi:hypothetical protein